MEWSIQDLARAAGTTSRTLRHYGQVGLLPPSRVGSNGYRYYDATSLVRLQRILLLRELGLGLPAIGEVLAGEQDTRRALHVHLELLEQERARLARQIAAVRTTVTKLEKGEELMADETLDGFDHRQYEGEVVRRWGRPAWDQGQRWWADLGPEGQRAHYAEHRAIADALIAAAEAGADPADDEVQALIARHYTWVSASWTPNAEAYVNLGQMYVDDPRFAANYTPAGADSAAAGEAATKGAATKGAATKGAATKGAATKGAAGEGGAAAEGSAGPAGSVTFVRDAMAVYADRHLS